MRKYLIFCFALLLTVACNKNQATINVNVENLPDSSVVLYKLNYKYFALVDTLSTDANGHVKYNVKLENENPSFYYIYTLDQKKLAGMILLPNDKVTINTNTSGVFTVEGSQESQSLLDIDNALAETIAKMDKIVKENPADANAQLSKLYVDHKRNMLRHIANNPQSITSATVVFQKINDQLSVFDEESDVIIFKSIYDSVKEVYPNSEYLIALMDEITARQNRFDLSNYASAAEFVGYPELSLPNINGEQVLLSKCVQKVTIVSFWTVNQFEHKMFNNELIDLYNKYHDKGFEVYQISLDDKPTWASAVNSQKLPWISVNDGLGAYSPSRIQYNVSEVPTMYIIDKEGNITNKDVFDIDELEKIIKKNIN